MTDKPKSGDRVRATFTGYFMTESYRDYQATAIRLSDGNVLLLAHADKVEVIEPEYIVGAVYQDARGRYFRRTKNDWYDITTGHGVYWKRFGQYGEYGFATPVRPLRRLVPE